MEKLFFSFLATFLIVLVAVAIGSLIFIMYVSLGLVTTVMSTAGFLILWVITYEYMNSKKEKK